MRSSIRSGLLGMLAGLAGLLTVCAAAAQEADPGAPPRQADLDYPPLQPDQRRYFDETGLGLLLIERETLDRMDADLGRMNSGDICDVALHQYASYIGRRSEFEARREAFRGEVTPQRFAVLERQVYDRLLASTMVLKACQSGYATFNAMDYYQMRLDPEDVGIPCRPLWVPGWMIEATINSKIAPKVLDLNCIDVSALSVYGKKFDYINVKNTWIGNFSLRFSEVSGAFAIEDSLFGEMFQIEWNTLSDLFINGISTASNDRPSNRHEIVEIQNNRIGNSIEIRRGNFGRKPYQDNDNSQHINPFLFTANKMGSELAIYDSTFNGRLDIGDTSATTVRIVNTEVAGQLGLHLIDAQKTIYIGPGDFGGGVYGHYIHADGIELYNVSTVGAIDLRSSQFTDKVYISDSSVDQLFFYDIETRPFIILGNVIDTIALEGVKSSLVVVGRGGDRWGENNRFGELRINDSVIENRIDLQNTIVGRRLAVTGTRVGNALEVLGRNVSFRPGARLDIRGLRTESLNIDLNALSMAGAGGKTELVRIDADGADFARFGVHSMANMLPPQIAPPFPQSQAALVQTALPPPTEGMGSGVVPAPKPPAGSQSEGSGAVPLNMADLPVDTLLDHFDLRDTKSYRAGQFDQLAGALEKSGRGDKARQVRIEKNRAYARNSESVVTKDIYAVAGLVNGFGYDNQHALLLYFACVVVGMVFYWLWINHDGIAVTARMLARPQRLSCKYRRLRGLARIRQRQIDPSDTTHNSLHRYNRGMIYAFFFSLDRSLPPLNLDSAFATQEGMWRPLAYWFFFQRAACFLVISLVLAGSLGMFQ